MRRAAGIVWLLAACGGPSGGPDAAIDAAAPDAPHVPAGTWDDPIPVGELPALEHGDTTTAPSRASAYDCAPTIDESGGEVVYRLHVDAGATYRLGVDDRPGDTEDVDLAVVSTPPDASGLATGCVARGNLAIEPYLAAGDWYVVVDSYMGNAGPFTLSIVHADPGACLVNPLPGCTDGDAPDPNGVITPPPGLAGCPDGMTKVDTFCIDRWEASLQGHSPYANPGTDVFPAVSAPDVVPQGYINQTQAAAACAASGKRLCTDTEWLRACQGAAGHTFPYGDARVDGACNDGRACHPAEQYFESTASWVFSMIDNSCILQLPDGVAPTGRYASCASDDGVWDMMGNLHEWTADPAGTFRGGYYVDTVLNGPGCLYVTTAHDVSHWDYSTGFRCCADAP